MELLQALDAPAGDQVDKNEIFVWGKGSDGELSGVCNRDLFCFLPLILILLEYRLLPHTK